MARREIGKEDIRNIQQSRNTYHVSIPIKMMRELGWQERQKVRFRREGKKLIVEDWEE